MTAQTIAALNDLLRRNFAAAPHKVTVSFKVVLTPGVGVLDQKAIAALSDKIEQFDAFTPDNDPHGEHDFGAVEHDGVRYFWKIDYYDASMDMGSPNAADPAVTCRVLTIMRAEEY